MRKEFQQLGLKHPLIQGPFGGSFSTPKLVAAVSNAGGLGSFGAHVQSPEAIEELGRDIRSLTNKAFALNLWVSDLDSEAEEVDAAVFNEHAERYRGLYEKYELPMPIWRQAESLFERQVEAVLRVKPAVFSFVFGLPSESILSEFKRQGILTVGAATTLAEAEAVEAAGVDMVVATGMEAGGHRPSFIKEAEESYVNTSALVRLVKRKIKIPVIAAGGIADLEGVKAALALGADAVQIGTAFLYCEESGASNVHREAIRSTDPSDTILSRAYTGRVARFVKNKFIRDFKQLGARALPFPYQSEVLNALKSASLEAGDRDTMVLYSGQGGSLVRHTRASELVNYLSAAFENS